MYWIRIEARQQEDAPDYEAARKLRIDVFVETTEVGEATKLAVAHVEAMTLRVMAQQMPIELTPGHIAQLEEGAEYAYYKAKQDHIAAYCRTARTDPIDALATSRIVIRG